MTEGSVDGDAEVDCHRCLRADDAEEILRASDLYHERVSRVVEMVSDGGNLCLFVDIEEMGIFLFQAANHIEEMGIVVFQVANHICDDFPLDMRLELVISSDHGNLNCNGVALERAISIVDVWLVCRMLTEYTCRSVWLAVCESHCRYPWLAACDIHRVHVDGSKVEVAASSCHERVVCDPGGTHESHAHRGHLVCHHDLRARVIEETQSPDLWRRLLLCVFAVPPQPDLAQAIATLV